MLAQVIVVAGPSGSGKSRLAHRTGLSVLRLDDFYKDGDDPTLPRLRHTGNAGLVDWDHPASWLAQEALAAIEDLCTTGAVDVPVYEIARNGRDGSRRLDLGGHRLFVAEGIFAHEIVRAAAAAGLLADALCVTQHPLVTFWRRLARDLREHRKPPLVLVRRGLALMREQRRVVTRAVDQGCRPVDAHRALAAVADLVDRAPAADDVS